MKVLKASVKVDSGDWDEFIVGHLSSSKEKTLAVMKTDFDVLGNLDGIGSVKLLNGVTYKCILDSLYVGGDGKEYNTKGSREQDPKKLQRNQSKVPEPQRNMIKTDCLKYKQMRTLISEPRDLVRAIYSEIPKHIKRQWKESDAKAELKGKGIITGKASSSRGSAGKSTKSPASLRFQVTIL
jgi:hypothetical protein